MPTYQYACTDCGHELEAVQSFTDDPLTQCPQCQGRLRKRFGSVGVVFKGSGFYRTDSRAASNGSSKRSGDSGGTSSGDTLTSGASQTKTTGTDSGSSSSSSATPAPKASTNSSSSKSSD